MEKFDKSKIIAALVEGHANKWGFLAETSRQTGIGADRLYKLKDGRAALDYDEGLLLAKHFGIITNSGAKDQHPDHVKYVELLERNNRTLEGSIQLSLDAIQRTLKRADDKQEETAVNLGRVLGNQDVLMKMLQVSLEQTADIQGQLRGRPAAEAISEAGKKLRGDGRAGGAGRKGQQGK